MLNLASQRNSTDNKRLVVVTFEGRVALLCLNADCPMSDAIRQMQNMFGIENKSTLTNLGCTCQSSDHIRGASKISQIRFDKRPRGPKAPKVIRLELS